MTFTVIVRTGTPERCEWQRLPDAFSTRDAARECAAKLDHALVHPTKALDSIGMPEGFEYAGR